MSTTSHNVNLEANPRIQRQQFVFSGSKRRHRTNSLFLVYDNIPSNIQWCRLVLCWISIYRLSTRGQQNQHVARYVVTDPIAVAAHYSKYLQSGLHEQVLPDLVVERCWSRKILFTLTQEVFPSDIFELNASFELLSQSCYPRSRSWRILFDPEILRSVWVQKLTIFPSISIGTGTVLVAGFN